MFNLNQRLKAEDRVSIHNFRPNIEVLGTRPYEEDNWGRIKIGNVTFTVFDNCSRCKVTTINPQTAEANEAGEPLRTLRKYRVHENSVVFGQKLAQETPGVIRVGDEIIVISSKPEFQIPD